MGKVCGSPTDMDRLFGFHGSKHDGIIKDNKTRPMYSDVSHNGAQLFHLVAKILNASVRGRV